MLSVMVTRLGVEPERGKRIRQTQGATIRNVRTLRGLSIHDFAHAVGVTDGAVSQWETGRFTPRQEVQVRIAEVLNVPWSTIFGLDSQVVV